jgi:YVTN family beta-propeller protein
MSALYIFFLVLGLSMTGVASAQQFAYVANSGSRSVSVIDTLTNTEVDVVTVGNGPDGIAVDSTCSSVYVALFADSTLVEIDTATHTVVSAVHLGIDGISSSGVAVSPDASRVYATNINSDTLSVIDTVNNSSITTIEVGSAPLGLAISPDGNQVYVANSNGNNVSVIATATDTVIATAAVGSPGAAVVNPEGSLLYVPNIVSGNVAVISTATNNQVTSVSVGDNPTSIAISPDGSRVYVVNFALNSSVSVIDTATNTVVTTVDVGAVSVSPYSIAVSPDGKRVYVTNGNDDSVSVIDTATNTVVATVAVGNAPSGVAVCEPPAGGGPSNSFGIDNPQEGDIVGGNVAINGFHCAAAEQGVRLQFDNIDTPTPIGLTRRTDILSPDGPCDDINDAFVANFLWSLLPEGPHQLKFFLGTASTPFTTLNVNVVHAQSGTEFFTGAAGECRVTDFPAAGQDTIVEWRQSLQNFTIADVIPGS